MSAALVLEDDPVVATIIAHTLAGDGLAAQQVDNRLELLRAVQQEDCDLVVLDVMLPGDDGMDIARAVREVSAVPIIFVTALKGADALVAGLDTGADDFIEKPFSTAELSARARAIVRRYRGRIADVDGDCLLRLGPASLGMPGRRLHGPLGEVVLTSRETNVLLTLARAGGALTRIALYRKAFGRPWNPRDRSLDVHVSRLRAKFAQVTGIHGVVVCERAVGYRLVVDSVFVKGLHGTSGLAPARSRDAGLQTSPPRKE